MPRGMLQAISVMIDTMYMTENLPPLSKPQQRYVPIALPQIATRTTHIHEPLMRACFLALRWLGICHDGFTPLRLNLNCNHRSCVV
jgi:predicted small integral membrane protein